MKFTRKAFIATTGLVIAAGTLLTSPVQAQTTLRLAHHHAVGGTVDQTANKFAEIVKSKSGGSLLIRVFPAAQLGQEREAYGLLNTGVLDLSITSLAILDQVYPAINVTSLPFVFRDWAHVNKVYSGTFGDALRDGVKANTKTINLGYIHLGFRQMMFRGEPVRDVANMKGLKMRAPESPLWVRMYELLGAKPTLVTWGETYTALQAGVAEGLDSPASSALDMKFNEVVKSVVLTNHMFGSMGIFGSQSRLGALSKAQQDLLISSGLEATHWSNTTLSEPLEAEAGKKMLALGMKIVEPVNLQAWAAAMQPLWRETNARSPGADTLLKMIVETK